MDPARKAGSRVAIWTTGWLLLLPPLLLLEGAQALECYSCVQKADDGCSPQKTKTVKCAPGVDVCTEVVGAVETIHGQFSVAVRGCGSGLPGKNDRGLDLYGILAFVQLQQCSQDRCNAQLDLTSRALIPAGNESDYEPNGAECYSCVGLSRKECQGTAPPVVRCYNASDHVYRGCFDGNVTLTAGPRSTFTCHTLGNGIQPWEADHYGLPRAFLTSSFLSGLANGDADKRLEGGAFISPTPSLMRRLPPAGCVFPPKATAPVWRSTPHTSGFFQAWG
ncbi:ly6/PLAUR domain-containing protein 3 isoform X2 [Balaenoptera acutorostrata]|uniref:Ly6/PLAUR domain-containing protein 3 isoform X2 n=1 Tax=Balaenoptera acutorostrata TaxID=9767 RepID=A0ABM3SMJ2_BALAC|nr:ly6/PLAUR domain-containing protein 3 isoform X2 [Balaenoptera acutorostrata]